MWPAKLASVLQPCDELGHAPRCIERRGGLKHDADHLAVGIKRAHIVAERLVFAAMALVLGTMAQKVPVQLLNMILRDGYLGPGMKDRFHHLGVARNFLLVPCGEFLDFKVGEHLLNLPVGELAPLDARGRANTLDSGDTAKGVQPVWAMIPSARQAPLNSSISERSSRRSAVICMLSVEGIPNFMPDYTGL